MENVVYANGFEEYIEGTKSCPPKELPTGDLNPDFVQWRRFDRMLRLEFQTTKKGGDSMLDYILKMKTIYDNLAVVGEPVKDRDHILQLLGGLGPDYNSIVASLTAREDDLSLHSVYNILLTMSKINLQHSSLQIFLCFCHMAYVPSRQPSRQPSRPHQPRNNGVPPAQASFSHVMHAAAPDHQDSWFFDTGATHHLSHSAQTLSCVQPYLGTDQVTIGDGNSLPILHTGAPAAHELAETPTGHESFSSSSPPRAFVTTSSFSDGAIWHSRLGHPTAPILSKALASCNPSVTLQINKIDPCIICPLVKSHSLPYSLSSSHASHPLAVIHTDLWGPTPSISITGARYFLIFIDDYSRNTWIYFLSTKDQALHSFITFRKMVENQLHTTIKCIQFDNGGEFLAFKPYLEAHAHKGYLCLDVSTSRIYISRNVIFHESSFPFQSSYPPPSPPPHLSSSTPALINSPSLSAPSSPVVSFPIITSDSIHPLIPVPFATSSPAAPSPPPLSLNTHPMVTRAKSGIHKKRSFIVQHTTEPRTYSQASKNDSWVQAMNREYQALLRNNTWSLVPPPSSAHIVGCRWIYKLKYRPNGSIDRHKARLVAQGFTQTPGIDYFDTFSPVVKPCTIRLILALAVSFQWSVRQLDVENAFLNGDLEEEKLRIALLDYGFQSSRADTSLFIFHTASDILILLVYVDDILVTGSSPTLVSHFISYLSAKFALRDLGPLSYFLGIQAHQLGSVLHLTQHKYIVDLLKRT
uniref:Integrase catalytic domain-containing protein n=1 Tax=Vitis vinifera TaxID=29760 RepID=A5AVA8_VITVI|nr:hypothetical protein VITISV_021745 [Vitis vinifera]